MVPDGTVSVGRGGIPSGRGPHSFIFFFMQPDIDRSVTRFSHGENFAFDGSGMAFQFFRCASGRRVVLPTPVEVWDLHVKHSTGDGRRFSPRIERPWR